MQAISGSAINIYKCFTTAVIAAFSVEKSPWKYLKKISTRRYYSTMCYDRKKSKIDTMVAT